MLNSRISCIYGPTPPFFPPRPFRLAKAACTFWDMAQVSCRCSQINLAGWTSEICPPVMLIHRIFLIEVELEELVVDVALVVLVSILTTQDSLST